MFDPPKTLEEAKKYSYGNYATYGENRLIEGRCVYEVSDPPHYIYFHQCTRKSGHGPEGLYCKQHSKMVKP